MVLILVFFFRPSPIFPRPSLPPPDLRRLLPSHLASNLKILKRPKALLLLQPIIRRLFGNDHIMDVAFAHAGGTDL